MNEVQLVGILASEVGLNKLEEGQEASFILEVTRPEGGSDLFRIRGLGHAAEALADEAEERGMRGRRAAVAGTLRHEAWTDAPGQSGKSVHVQARFVEFLN